MRHSILGLLVGLSLTVTACNQKKVTTVVTANADRNRQLTVLAASEASRIKDPDSRITRQLNIAELVLARFGADDAHAVLTEATKTLREVGGGLGSHARISGWVSVSQLARRAVGIAHDGLSTTAKQATAEAQRELEALPDVGERCQYVLGVAEEVSQLSGEAAAVELLTKGGTWAKGIASDNERRTARLAFAVALFNLNAYESGVATLRSEEDPTWSSDTMLALASMDANRYENEHAVATPSGLAAVFGAQAPAKEAPRAPAPAPSSMRYGRQLGYDSVFRGSTSSRTAH